jgi:hypothetical protein
VGREWVWIAVGFGVGVVLAVVTGNPAFIVSATFAGGLAALAFQHARHRDSR